MTCTVVHIHCTILKSNNIWCRSSKATTCICMLTWEVTPCLMRCSSSVASWCARVFSIMASTLRGGLGKYSNHWPHQFTAVESSSHLACKHVHVLTTHKLIRYTCTTAWTVYLKVTYFRGYYLRVKSLYSYIISRPLVWCIQIDINFIQNRKIHLWKYVIDTCIYSSKKLIQWKLSWRQCFSSKFSDCM